MDLQKSAKKNVISPLSINPSERTTSTQKVTPLPVESVTITMKTNIHARFFPLLEISMLQKKV